LAAAGSAAAAQPEGGGLFHHRSRMFTGAMTEAWAFGLNRRPPICVLGFPAGQLTFAGRQVEPGVQHHLRAIRSGMKFWWVRGGAVGHRGGGRGAGLFQQGAQKAPGRLAHGRETKLITRGAPKPGAGRKAGLGGAVFFGGDGDARGWRRLAPPQGFWGVGDGAGGGGGGGGEGALWAQGAKGAGARGGLPFSQRPGTFTPRGRGPVGGKARRRDVWARGRLGAGGPCLGARLGTAVGGRWLGSR